MSKVSLSKAASRCATASTSSSAPQSRSFSSTLLSHRNLPSRRPRDPLANDPSAIRHRLPAGETLIIRPSPSIQSPYNLEPFQGDMSIDGVPSKMVNLPPALKPSTRHTLQKTNILSLQDIKDLQSLRRKDPIRNTASSLAKQFRVSPLFISIIAPLSSDHRKLIDHQLEIKKANWGANKTLQRILRRERKALW